MNIPYTITIDVDPPGLVPSGGSVGNFVYTPGLLHVEADDYVTWNCQYPFTLVFKDGTPIDKVRVIGYPSTLGGFQAGPFTVRQVKGQFHYAIAAVKDGNIYMDAACADLSVN